MSGAIGLKWTELEEFGGERTGEEVHGQEGKGDKITEDLILGDFDICSNIFAILFRM